MRAPHRAVLGAFTAFVVMAVAACGGDGSTGPGSGGTPDTPVGNYALTSVNGKPVPVTMFADTEFTEVIAKASLALTTDGKYQAVVTTNETIAGNVSVYVDTSAGTWKQGATASALVLTSTDDPSMPTVPATWSGKTLTLTDADSAKWVFTRP
jgi:hypothetical protein